jgi:hypothetical protein
MVLTNLANHFKGAVIFGETVVEICDLSPFNANEVVHFSPEIFVFRASPQ